MLTTASLLRSTPLSIVFCLLITCTIQTVGLPIRHQEHGSDLIAGEDFLSMLMSRTTFSENNLHSDDHKTHPTESTLPTQEPITTERTLPQESDLENRLSETPSTSASDKPEDGTIIAVRVSSTIGHSMINKHVYAHKEESIQVENEEITTQGSIETTTMSIEEDDEGELLGAFKEISKVEKPMEKDGKDQGDQAIASEETPSLIAEANKSEFTVDESEPISRDYSPLPSPHPYEAKPFQGAVIYHNDNTNNRARSVSYSTVIQAIPSIQKTWNPSSNTSMTPDHVPNSPDTQKVQGHAASMSNSAAESKDYYVTSKYNPSEYNESIDKQYESSSHRYYSPEPTERNWGIPEKSYHEPSKPYTPIVYGQPEQNYEVDEAVSVETNGRAHGVQPVVPSGPHQVRPNEDHPNKSSKKDDNQKVGYVVEGRNYRKYRVEERTSDGFIVGEYGVVRHDDGSLRGVRYTADGTISPRLIYDALMKFLSL